LRRAGGERRLDGSALGIVSRRGGGGGWDVDVLLFGRPPTLMPSAKPLIVWPAAWRTEESMAPLVTVRLVP